jgi:hypothetical protein
MMTRRLAPFESKERVHGLGWSSVRSCPDTCPDTGSALECPDTGSALESRSKSIQRPPVPPSRRSAAVCAIALLTACGPTPNCRPLSRCPSPQTSQANAIAAARAQPPPGLLFHGGRAVSHELIISPPRHGRFHRTESYLLFQGLTPYQHKQWTRSSRYCAQLGAQQPTEPGDT